ncbi:hypothetical protein, partial [Salmonella enterica]|uniref:hypothetical protein n=1 Tax=Salmonella enterica TaxID=28901 RepID=UPI000AA4A2C9
MTAGLEFNLSLQGARDLIFLVIKIEDGLMATVPVSYTHLPLPTIHSAYNSGVISSVIHQLFRQCFLGVINRPTAWRTTLRSTSAISPHSLTRMPRVTF